MKNVLPTLVVAGVILSALTGCGQKEEPGASAPADTAGTPGSTMAGPPVKQTGASITAVPDTTVVDGKTVKLNTTSSGLKYYDIKVGTGKEAKNGDKASVQYLGTLLDGSKFDSSYDRNEPFEFSLGKGQVIKGWDEGVVGMKVGGKRRLVVPGDLAYGAQSPSPEIPPNATLVFDVELVDVK